MKTKHQTQAPKGITMSPAGTGRTTLTPEKPIVGRRSVVGETLKHGSPDENTKTVKPGGKMTP